MQNLIGVINSVDSNSNKYETLTKNRPDYMLPYGARYRIIDFTLSNLSRYNLSKVNLFCGRNIRSTLDHIGNGKSWELNRRNHGLTINPPSYYFGVGLISEIRSYYDSMDYFFNANQEHIFLCDPMVITKIDIQEAYKDYLDNDYDIMLIYKNVDDKNLKFINTKKLNLEGNRVKTIGENLGIDTHFNMYISRLFIKKSVFIELVSKAIELGNAGTLIDAIMNSIGEYKVGAHESKNYVQMIRDANSYYEANLSLLNPEVYEKVFYEGGMILTKSKDEPSTMYKDNAKVKNSLVANGCIIEGHVENSIIFRGVKVEKNAIVKNSLLIQQSQVGEDSIVINSILDKYSRVDDSVSLIGAMGNPYIVGKSERIRG